VTDFKQEYLGSFVQGGLSALHALALRYANETEAFDRSVCTGPLLNGEIMPVTGEQRQKSTQHARKMDLELWREARALGFSYQQWRTAVRNTGHTLDDHPSPKTMRLPRLTKPHRIILSRMSDGSECLDCPGEASGDRRTWFIKRADGGGILVEEGKRAEFYAPGSLAAVWLAAAYDALLALHKLLDLTKNTPHGR
jgi:hypothetical protein